MGHLGGLKSSEGYLAIQGKEEEAMPRACIAGLEDGGGGQETGYVGTSEDGKGRKCPQGSGLPRVQRNHGPAENLILAQQDPVLDFKPSELPGNTSGPTQGYDSLFRQH